MTRKISKSRADLLLVEMGLAESREQAQALIMEGLVYSPSGKVLKPGSSLAVDVVLEVKGRIPYVSRGGIKLAHALDRFRIEVVGMVALDVGASTGGFTDCLLQRGAQKVFAVDVGHGQIDYRLRRDHRVVVKEKVNVRHSFSLRESSSTFVGDGGGEPMVDMVTVDVSFISVTKVMLSVASHVKDGGSIIVLVKPQFEARREEVGKGGVIKDPAVHATVLSRVIGWVVNQGFRLRDLTSSPILGDAGNREFFMLLNK